MAQLWQGLSLFWSCLDMALFAIGEAPCLFPQGPCLQPPPLPKPCHIITKQIFSFIQTLDTTEAWKPGCKAIGHTGCTVELYCNVWVSVFELFQNVLQMGLHHHVLIKFPLHLIWSDSYPPLENGVLFPSSLSSCSFPWVSFDACHMLFKNNVACFLSWWVWLAHQSIWCFYTFSDSGKWGSLLLWC